MNPQSIRVRDPLHTNRGVRINLYLPFYSNNFGLLLMS
jgi:hypothetical protein